MSALVPIPSQHVGEVPQPPIPFTPDGTPWPLDEDGVTILAAAFDITVHESLPAWNDDPGLANQDSFPQSIRTDTDVEIAPTGAIGWTRVGEWVQYTISVEKDGVYNFSAQMATPNEGRNISAWFSADGILYEVTSPIETPVTGSYVDFASTLSVPVGLVAGVNVVRINFGGGDDQDFESFSLVPVESAAANSADSFSSGPSASSDLKPLPVADFALLSPEEDAHDTFRFDATQGSYPPALLTADAQLSDAPELLIGSGVWTGPLQSEGATWLDTSPEGWFADNFVADALGLERHIDIQL